jgi:hypothetical protein
MSTYSKLNKLVIEWRKQANELQEEENFANDAEASILRECASQLEEVLVNHGGTFTHY